MGSELHGFRTSWVQNFMGSELHGVGTSWSRYFMESITLGFKLMGSYVRSYSL
jgi:hypothetical protein